MPLKTRGRQAVGAFLNGLQLATRVRPALTVLMYHAVTADRVDDAGQMSVSAADFERQLVEIRDIGLAVTDLASGVQRLRRGQLHEPSVAIVFDDGFVGVHEYAAPTLARFAFPATVFVTTSWIGRPSVPLAPSRLGRALTWSEVDALNVGGMTIGSHTHTHPCLADLSADAMQVELRTSQETIAEHTGRRPDTFAYPFGGYDTFNARTRAALEGAGFSVACTTIWGRNDMRCDPLAIKRMRVSWCDGPGEIRKSTAGCYDWYSWVQRFQSPKLAAQEPITLVDVSASTR